VDNTNNGGKIFRGKVMAITNNSGHYQPTLRQGEASVDLLKNVGIDVKGAHVTLYNENGTPAKSYVVP